VPLNVVADGMSKDLVQRCLMMCVELSVFSQFTLLIAGAG
jgi:hypothetical protein